MAYSVIVVAPANVAGERGWRLKPRLKAYGHNVRLRGLGTEREQLESPRIVIRTLLHAE